MLKKKYALNVFLFQVFLVEGDSCEYELLPVTSVGTHKPKTINLLISDKERKRVCAETKSPTCTARDRPRAAWITGRRGVLSTRGLCQDQWTGEIQGTEL